ncbi:MAG: DUF4911 domain-containing protein [Dissulfurimicrobium sp.]|uniref:DUF4911 domain-containing protein n=1 Tax=Dissulfurimicrobium sp. TaxID=2022436 RepID=UPI00404A6452
MAIKELKRFILRIEPSSVYFLRFILEGYDNMYMVSTLDQSKGLVRIISAHGAQDDLMEILESLKEKIKPVFIDDHSDNKKYS